MLRTIALAAILGLTGGPLAGAWTLGPESRLTVSPGASWSPVGGVSGDTIHIVWLDYGQVVDSEVLYLRSRNGGITWEPPRALTNDTYLDVDPSLVVDGQDLYVTYTAHAEPYPDRPEIHFICSHDGGDHWSVPVRISATSGDSESSWITLAPNGTLHVVWRDNSLGFSQVYAARSTDRGATWCPPALAGRPDEILDSEFPQLIASPSGELLIFMRDNRRGYPFGGNPPYSVFQVRSVDGGATWLIPPLALSATLPGEFMNAYDHGTMMDSSGTIHVNWWENRHGSNVAYRRSTDGGFSWSPQIMLSSFPETHPMHEIWGRGYADIVERVPGELWAVFGSHWNVGLETPRRRGDLYLAGSTDGGASWSAPAPITSSGLARDARLLRLSETRLGVVWQDERDDIRPESPNWGDELYFRTIEFGAVQDHAPRIYGAGWWQSMISASEGGLLQLVAMVSDPDGSEDVVRVELCYGGEPLGILLEPGSGGFAGMGTDELYGIQVEIPPGTSTPGLYSIEIEVEDASGNLARWPYLEVFGPDGVAPYTAPPMDPGIDPLVYWQAPQVYLAGFWDTRLTSDQGGVLTIIAKAHDANGDWDLQRVELAYDGVGTGILLDDRGHAGGVGDEVAGDDFYTWKVSIPPGALEGLAGTVPFSIQVVDLSDHWNEWPYLAIWE